MVYIVFFFPQHPPKRTVELVDDEVFLTTGLPEITRIFFPFALFFLDFITINSLGW